MNDDIHTQRQFKAVAKQGLFRTGSADLTVWVKESDCCARPLQNGQGQTRKFPPSQSVFILKDGQRR